MLETLLLVEDRHILQACSDEHDRYDINSSKWISGAFSLKYSFI